MRARSVASLAIVAALVLALEIACRGGLLRPTVIIPPSAMADALWSLLRSGTFDGAIARTFGNVAITALIAIIGGFAIAVLLQAHDFLRRGIEPFLAASYAVPTFIFYPVFIIVFGVGSAAIIAIAVLFAIVAMISATLTGLDRIPPVLGRTARALRLSRLETAWRVQLPAAAPFLFTGARLAVAYAFIGVIASEFILSGDGLGYAIAYAYNNFDNRTMYGLMLLVVLVTVTVNAMLGALDRHFARHRG